MLPYSLQAFDEWIENLPNKSSPMLLGLPAAAESKVQSDMGRRCLQNLSCVQNAFDTEIVDSTSGSGSDSVNRLKSVRGIVEVWLKMLPEHSALPVIPAEKTSEVTSSSMDRCLAREIMKAVQVLSRVRRDLIIVRYV